MPNDEETKARLNAVATLIGFEEKGWLSIISTSDTVAVFKLDRLPPQAMITNYIRMLCVKYNLSQNVYIAASLGHFSITPENGSHVLRIGTSTSNQEKAA
jgi:hypothetical protein